MGVAGYLNSGQQLSNQFIIVSCIVCLSSPVLVLYLLLL